MPAYLRPGLEVAALFVAGLTIGVAMQAAGLLPGNAAGRVAAVIWSRPVPAPPVAPILPPAPRADITTALPDPLVRLVPRFPASPPQPVGDDDPDRNALRRALIVASHRALAAPCDLDRRVAFQSALRDYSRAWANSPRTARERSDFRTPLDAEAVRAVGIAHRAGLIDPELIGRWRNLERTGLDELLAKERGSVSDDTPEPCSSARRA